MGALAQVAFQSLEERRGIDACGKCEVLSANHADAVHLAKIRALTDHGAGDRHLDVYFVLGHSHAGHSLLTRYELLKASATRMQES